MNNTTENRVADAVLQKDFQIRIGGKPYTIPQPTLGTIIEVSSLISTIGVNEFNTKDFIESPHEVLRIAKNYAVLPRILAIFAVGKQRIKKIKIFGYSLVFDFALKRLERKIENQMTPMEMAEALVAIFSRMECAFFLQTITSLNKINHLKPTTSGTTQSGPQ